MSHIFVGYHIHNAEFAAQLSIDIIQNGFDIWIDDESMWETRDWWRSVVLSIKKSSAVIVILSTASSTSERIKRELKFAYEIGIPIYPLWLDGELELWDGDWLDHARLIDARGQSTAPAQFYSELEKHVIRQTRGQDITGEMEAFGVTLDRRTVDEIANPPGAEPTTFAAVLKSHADETHPTRPPQVTSPSQVSPLLLIFAGVIIVILACIIALSTIT